MTFSIRFLPEHVPESEVGNAAQYGEIQLRDYRETFVALISFWSPLDYTQHWSRSIRRLVNLRRESCLITSLYDPRITEIMHWWLLYPVGDDVFVQNALLVEQPTLSQFDTRNPYKSIPARSQVSDEGEPVSEWLMSMKDFRDFLE